MTYKCTVAQSYKVFFLFWTCTYTFSVSLYLLDRNRFTEKSQEIFPGTNPYKRKRRVKDEDRVPPSIREKFAEEILDLVLYDVENCQALRDFEPIKMNTHCIFAKKSILWGACDYDQSLSVGKT